MLRLGAALAASFALHAALGLGLGALGPGEPDGGKRTPTATTPLQVELRIPLAESREPAKRTAPAGGIPDSRQPLPLPQPRYYLSSELDVRPLSRGSIEPGYPEAAARLNLSGVVVMRLYLDESGNIERAVTVRSDPPGYFEEAAERAFTAARFTPGMKQGRPVKVLMTIEVRFDSPPRRLEPASNAAPAVSGS